MHKLYVWLCGFPENTIYCSKSHSRYLHGVFTELDSAETGLEQAHCPLFGFALAVQKTVAAVNWCVSMVKSCTVMCGLVRMRV